MDLRHWNCKTRRDNAGCTVLGTPLPIFYGQAGPTNFFNPCQQRSNIDTPQKQVYNIDTPQWHIYKQCCRDHNIATENMETLSPPTPTLQLRSIQHECNLRGTLTCPTPPQPFSCVASNMCNAQGTLTVNMPHPTLTFQILSKRKKSHFVPRPCSGRCPTTSSSCAEVTTATIAATPENTAPTTFRSISGFALPSVIHNNQFLL